MRQRVQDVLRQVGLPEDALERYPHAFSGGQRQRLAIARAIRGEPTIDELIANRKTVKHYSLEGLIEY